MEGNLCYECAYFGYDVIGNPECYRYLGEIVHLGTPYLTACHNFKKGE